MSKQLTITSSKIAVVLLCIISFLLLANLVVIYLYFVHGYHYLRGFFQAFFFDIELNFPSTYSAAAILFSALLLWVISNSEKGTKRSGYWRFFSLVLAFLAADEFCRIHESFHFQGKELAATLEIQSDYLLFPWLLPYSIVVVIVGIAFVNFFSKLPPRTRNLFVASAVVFLLGAVALEMVGSKYWAAQGWKLNHTDDIDMTYALIATAEELLEMLGIVIFIYALVGYYLRGRERTVIFRISDTPDPSHTTSTEMTNLEVEKERKVLSAGE